MYDPFFVRVIERVTDLPCDTQGFLEGERSLKGFARHEFHDEIVGPDIVQRADVGMIKGRHGAHFAVEALIKALGRDLDGHVAAGARVVCAVDLAHPAFADQRDDLVGAKFVASRQRHDWERFYSNGAVTCLIFRPTACREWVGQCIILGVSRKLEVRLTANVRE